MEGPGLPRVPAGFGREQRQQGLHQRQPDAGPRRLGDDRHRRRENRRGDGGDGLGGGEVTKKVGEDLGVWGKIQVFLGFGRYFLRIEDGSVETLHGEVMLVLWG